MVMYLDDVDAETVGAKKKTTKRRIQPEGVQVFDNYYFYPTFAEFLGAEVEVSYLENSLSSICVLLPNGKTVIAGKLDVIACDDLFRDDSEAAELTAVNRLLVAGLFQALELRGIFSAISDPLILQGEKVVLIERYKQIEANIRLAIEKSDR